MDTEYWRKGPIGVLGNEFDMFSFAKQLTNKFCQHIVELRITTKSHAYWKFTCVITFSVTNYMKNQSKTKDNIFTKEMNHRYLHAYYLRYVTLQERLRWQCLLCYNAILVHYIPMPQGYAYNYAATKSSNTPFYPEAIYHTVPCTFMSDIIWYIFALLN